MLELLLHTDTDVKLKTLLYVDALQANGLSFILLPDMWFIWSDVTTQ